MRQPFALAVFAATLAACGGGSSPAGPSSTPAAPASSATPAPTNPLLGTWRVMTSSGVDVSGLGGTMEVGAASIRENWPGICAKTYDYTLSGNTLSTVVTANSCTFNGSNEPVGFRGTSTFSLSGNNLTVSVPATGAVATLVRA